MMRGGKRPPAKAEKASAAMRVIIARLSCVTPAVCWVQITAGCDSSGGSCGGGSVGSATCAAPTTVGTWADYTGGFTWNGASGLRSLGFERTLTLVDGLRPELSGKVAARLFG